MSGRSALALGSALVGVGLVIGVSIGRSTVRSSKEAVQAPPEASSRFTEQLTDTTSVAAEPPAWQSVPEPARPQVTQPLVRPAPLVAKLPPPVSDAGAPEVAAPAPEPEAQAVAPPEAVPPAEPPPPDPYLVRQGRAFTDDEIARSSFDEEDVSEYSVVPDREVTRSSFDDDDRVNDHPTGR